MSNKVYHFHTNTTCERINENEILVKHTAFPKFAKVYSLTEKSPYNGDFPLLKELIKDQSKEYIRCEKCDRDTWEEDNQAELSAMKFIYYLKNGDGCLDNASRAEQIEYFFRLSLYWLNGHCVIDVDKKADERLEQLGGIEGLL